MEQSIPEHLRSPFRDDRVDEQAVTDELESLVGSNGAFRMMRIYQDCLLHARDTLYPERVTRQEMAAKAFKRRASGEGFSDEAIEFYLKYISWTRPGA